MRKKEPEERKSVLIMVRLTEADRATLTEKGMAAGMRLSTYIRYKAMLPSISDIKQ